MPADTALTLITDTLLDMGVIAGEATPRAAQSQQALRKLNQMLESWNIEGLLTYGVTPYLLTLTPGVGTYTLGPSGSVNITPRPDDIASAFVRDTSQPLANQADYPLNLFTDQEWQYIAFKNMTVQWPNVGIWINWTFPLAQINVWPIPTTSQYKIVLWIPDSIGQYTLNTAVSLPAGYRRAIVSNLYGELAATYQMEVPAETAKIALESLAIIKSNNLQIDELTPNFDNPGWYDITQNRFI